MVLDEMADVKLCGEMVHMLVEVSMVTVWVQATSRNKVMTRTIREDRRTMMVLKREEVKDNKLGTQK